MSDHQSNQDARNVDQSGTQDHASIYIEDMLRGVLPTSPEHSIFRVRHVLREANEKAYEPEILAVGPYHHGRDRCKFMEEQKMRCVQGLLERRNEESVHRYMPILRAMEQRARDCYAETIRLSPNEFLAMMLIDGCFIVEFLRKYGMNGPHMEAGLIQILPSLRRDLMLLENQLPLFVLNELYDMTKGPNEHCELIDIAIWYVSGQPVDLNRNATLRDMLRDSKHLLHLVHTCCTFGLPNAPRIEGSTTHMEVSSMLSAMELREAGVMLRAAHGRHLMDIKFKNGILEIPVFTVEDFTESKFRNLIAYEQHRQCGDISYVTDYMSFMDCLINSSKDVKLLRRQGIIRNCLGDDVVVAQIFNEIGHGVIVDDFYYDEIARYVNEYCNKKWNLWMAKLRREYFHSPWAFLSVLAAIVLLLLTAAQTVIAVLSCNKQS
ncbi:UPF0481 protein At3g47200-like [Rhodamnia argentea]|uniref:UPF0481 protein At3g47200-like n=1 Tax=Rhodamnia argentea TaxID=178133 RepID=A0ABM3H2C0_9MYRT|nr:UPF0481 protein At3g47200-like [Rhodamnia argentea]XP_048130755.1 UPF0481 protein At3g47200-like [Rhodamnia argentea]